MFGKSTNFNSKFQFDLSQFTNNIGNAPGITRPNFGSLPPNSSQTNGNVHHPARDPNDHNMQEGSTLNGSPFVFKPFQFHKPDSLSKSANGNLQSSNQNASPPRDEYTAFALNPVSSQAVVFKAAKLPKEIGSHHTADTTLTFRDWSKVYHGRIAFYVSTAKTFEKLHSSDSNAHNGSTKRTINGNAKHHKHDALYKYAPEYTTKLLDYQKQLNHDVRKETDAERKTVKAFVAIYHLCEFLFFSKEKEAPIAKEMVEWLNLTDKTALLKYDTQLIIHRPDPSGHPEFWEFVYKSILRGETQVATTLFGHAIKTVTATSIKAINELISILNAMPELYRNYSTTAESKYVKKRSKWLKDIETFGESLQQNKQNDPSGLTAHMLTLLKMIAGDRNIILEHSSNRHELIVAILLYTCPTTSRHDLPDVVRIADQKFPASTTDASEEACRAFMLGEIYEGIVACASEDWWLVAHLTDLFEMAELLESRSNLGLMVDVNDMELREYFILNYAQSLFSHSTLWEHALFYLNTCPTQGWNWMSELVLRVPPSNDATVSRLLKCCQRFQLHDQYKVICRVAAKRNVATKNFTKAVKYYQKANDTGSVVEISDQILDSYLDCGQLISSHDLLEIKGQNTTVGGSFNFLLLYSQFREHLSSGSNQQASQLLLQLFTLPSSRKDLWPILFIDALPLFQDNSTFNQEDTFQLLHYLEQLCVFSRGSPVFFNSIPRYIQRMRSDSVSATEQDLADMVDTFYETVRFGLTRMLAHEFLT
ncbi:hypothetical protein Unana1_04307 [Umbelopsis nana]